MWVDFSTWYTCWVFLCKISHQMVQMYFMELLYCTMKSHPTHVILPLPCIMKKICSGKKAPYVILFFLSCAGQKFPGKTFQLSHMFVLLLSFESHYFNISIHHSRLHLLQQDHFCFHILWSFVTVNMFLGLFSLKGSLTSQESNCLIWTIPFL